MLGMSSKLSVLAQRKSRRRKVQTGMTSRLERLPEKDVSTSAPLWPTDLTSTGCFVCLLSAVAYAVMSTKKKVGAVVKKSSSKRAKRVRSISMSLDLECLPSRSNYGSYGNYGEFADMGMLKKSLGHLRGGVDRYRTVSACEGKYLGGDTLTPDRLRQLTAGAQGQKDKFPFDKLPVDCKLKVFSFLTSKERGVASQVCSEWGSLIKSSSLWNIVDLTAFPLCHNQSQSHECSELCYALYRNRVKKFFQYLHFIRPVVKRLRFAFDIGDYRDGWLECLQGLLRSSHCKDLEMADLNWKETPVKPYWRDSVTWSTSDYNELMHRNRHRQRLFVNFFTNFTAAAPNLGKLVMPFDWSPRSLQALARLHKLEVLVLEKYFVFQCLEQDVLDQLFQNVPELRHLVLEVWTPSGRGLLLYSIKAEKLCDLDISQCRGFYVKEMDLPSLEVFKVSRHPWHGPLQTSDSIHIPCIYDVLREGAPKLRQINEHVLHQDWREQVYEELSTVLKGVCSCRQHKWVM